MAAPAPPPLRLPPSFRPAAAVRQEIRPLVRYAAATSWPTRFERGESMWHRASCSPAPKKGPTRRRRADLGGAATLPHSSLASHASARRNGGPGSLGRRGWLGSHDLRRLRARG